MDFIRGALFIFWVLATLSVLGCDLTFALERLTFLNITTFRTFCHLSVICVVYSDLKIVSEQINGINSWRFSCDDLLWLSTWVIKQEYINQLISTFGDETHSMLLWNASIRWEKNAIESIEFLSKSMYITDSNQYAIHWEKRFDWIKENTLFERLSLI